MISAILETSMCIMAISLICYSVFWLSRKVFKNEVIELPDNGYLLLNPTMIPKYFFDHRTAQYYMSKCEEGGITFDVYRIKNGKIDKKL